MKMRNRRLIEAIDKDDLRVLGIGIDLVIPNDVDGRIVMSRIQRILNRELKGVARVAGIAFHEDFTDVYEEDYPDELYID